MVIPVQAANAGGIINRTRCRAEAYRIVILDEKPVWTAILIIGLIEREGPTRLQSIVEVGVFVPGSHLALSFRFTTSLIQADPKTCLPALTLPEPAALDRTSSVSMFREPLSPI